MNDIILHAFTTPYCQLTLIDLWVAWLVILTPITATAFIVGLLKLRIQK